MDLSSYIPVYVRADGDDENDGLTVGNAKATVQAAYNAALALVVADGPASFTVAGTSDPYDSGTYVEEVSTINGRPSFKPVNASICVLFWDRHPLFGERWLVSGDVTTYSSTGNPAYPETATWPDGVTVTPTMPVPKYVLDIGAGTFAGVVLAADWNWRIAVRGAGATSSFLGGINGAGADEYFIGDPDYTTVPATAGFNVVIVSDNTVNLGAISTACGVGSSGSGGGNVTLTDSTSGAISTTGGDGYNGGDGGNVSLTTSTSGAISTTGGVGSSDSGGDGGNVSLTTSTSGAISTTGGVGYSEGGNGARISLTDSISGAISTTGGVGYNGGNGASVTLTDSISGAISTTGGSGSGSGGDGASVTLTDSISGAISTTGGSGSIYGSGGSGTTTLHGHYRFQKNSTIFQNTSLVIGSDWIAPDILGAGLL